MNEPSTSGGTRHFSLRREYLQHEPCVLTLQPIRKFPLTIHEVTLDGKLLLVFRQRITSQRTLVIRDVAGRKVGILKRTLNAIYHSTFELCNKNGKVDAHIDGKAHAKDSGSNARHARDLRAVVTFHNEEWPSDDPTELVIDAKSVSGEDTDATLRSGFHSPEVVARFSRAPSSSMHFSVICNGGVDALLMAAAAMATAIMAQEVRERPVLSRRMYAEQEEIVRDATGYGGGSRYHAAGRLGTA